MTSVFQAEYVIFLLLALLLDGVLGGRKFLGRIPGPDQAIYFLLGQFSKRLDRPDRGKGALVVRGLLVLFSLMVVSAGLGLWIDSWKTDSWGGQLFTVLLLALTVGQHNVWELVREIMRALTEPQHANAPKRYGATRWAVERLALRFSDGLIANGLFYLLGGFALLLPFRALSMMMATGAPSGLKPAPGPYYFATRILFALVATVPSLIASIFIILAWPFTPKARFLAMKGLWKNMSSAATSGARRRPLSVIAYAFGWNFRVHPAEAGPESWIGPRDGKARLSASDLGRAVFLVMVAGALVILVLLALLGLLLSV